MEAMCQVIYIRWLLTEIVPFSGTKYMFVGSVDVKWGEENYVSLLHICPRSVRLIRLTVAYRAFIYFENKK